jgi:hypothetical protein
MSSSGSAIRQIYSTYNSFSGGIIMKRRAWLYLKLAVLLLFAVMMFSNRQVSADAASCSGSCTDDCWFSTCCKCQTELSCGCFIASGEKGCGSCQAAKLEE